MAVAKEQIRQIISENNINSVADIYTLLKDSFKDILQELMEAELDATPGFEKIELKAGESKIVTFDIKDQQLGFYDNAMKFTVEKGDFTFMIGGNSEELKEIVYNY